MVRPMMTNEYSLINSDLVKAIGVRVPGLIDSIHYLTKRLRNGSSPSRIGQIGFIIEQVTWPRLVHEYAW